MVDKLTDDNVDDGCKLVSKLIIKKHRISYHEIYNEIYNEIQSFIQGGKEEEGEDEEENGRKRMKIIDDSNKNEMDISKSNDKSNDYMYAIIDQLILKSIDVGYLPENGIEIDQENNMIYLLPSSYLHLKNNSFFKPQTHLNLSLIH